MYTIFVNQKLTVSVRLKNMKCKESYFTKYNMSETLLTMVIVK